MVELECRSYTCFQSVRPNPFLNVSVFLYVKTNIPQVESKYHLHYSKMMEWNKVYELRNINTRQENIT